MSPVGTTQTLAMPVTYVCFRAANLPPQSRLPVAVGGGLVQPPMRLPRWSASRRREGTFWWGQLSTQSTHRSGGLSRRGSGHWRTEKNDRRSGRVSQHSTALRLWLNRANSRQGRETIESSSVGQSGPRSQSWNRVAKTGPHSAAAERIQCAALAAPRRPIAGLT